MRMECLDCSKSLEDCTCIEDTIEFTEADIEVFIDGIENPDEPNQALIEAAERYKERMYSEEDMIEFGFSTYCYISELMGVPFNLISENRLNAEDWFEQFKKNNKKLV